MNSHQGPLPTIPGEDERLPLVLGFQQGHSHGRFHEPAVGSQAF